MNSIFIGTGSLAGVLVLMGLGAPVGVALGVASIAGLVLTVGWVPTVSIVVGAPFDFAASWTLTAIPLFLLMSAVIHHSGIASHLYRAARLWLSFLPGGLAVAANVAAAGFAAISGSSMATAASMAQLSVPEMLKAGYDPRLATGAVASAGTLGALIPPSVMMVLYSIFAEVPISRMLIAGILPGLLTALIYILMIVGRCARNPKLAPKIDLHVTWAERFDALYKIWPVPVLIIAILVGIYSGFVSATEAAAFGCVVSLGLAAALRQLSWKTLRISVVDALQTTAQIFFIAIGAVMLTRLMVLSGLPFAMADLFESVSSSPYLFLLFMTFLFLILGMFLDPLGVMLIALPMLLPIAHRMNLDLIWIGVLVVKLIEIGLLTPPVGFNVFVVHSTIGEQVSLNDIFRGVLWFLACEAFIMLILVLVPALSTWLPHLMYAR